MKAIELVQLVKTEEPELFKTIPANKAATLVRRVLEQVRKQVESTEEGVVVIPGFGSIKIRQVEQDKGGRTSMMKRYIFQPIDPNAKKN